mgnify:CR=1 FL=1
MFFFVEAEDGIRDRGRDGGLGDVYKSKQKWLLKGRCEPVTQCSGEDEVLSAVFKIRVVPRHYAFSILIEHNKIDYNPGSLYDASARRGEENRESNFIIPNTST